MARSGGSANHGLPDGSRAGGCHWGVPGGPCTGGADAVAGTCRNGSGPGAGHSGMPRRGGPLGRIRRPRPAGQVPCRGCHWGLPGGPCAGGADAVARSCRNGSGPGADHSGMPRRGGPLGRIRRPRPARQVPCRGCHWGLPGGPCAGGADAVARSCRNGSGPGAGHSGMPRQGGPLPVVAQTRREQSHSSTSSDSRTGAGVAATPRADAAHAGGRHCGLSRRLAPGLLPLRALPHHARPPWPRRADLTPGTEPHGRPHGPPPDAGCCGLSYRPAPRPETAAATPRQTHDHYGPPHRPRGKRSATAAQVRVRRGWSRSSPRP
ncbi:hypothetical protein M2163_004384 [Streptomyces sp. SAI-135]|nr:hypothetical protein [Streptomyces sp. SAI-090]MDH6617276.1 hypothetical protein [Streptomyces sp. SAI-135]